MRKFIFINLIILFSIEEIFSNPKFDYLDLKFTSSLVFPSETSEKEKSLSAAAGVKIFAEDLFLVNKLDARCYATLPKTSFSDFPVFPDEPRFGVGLYLFEESLPTQLKIGQNSFSKSISRLKNPSPSGSGNPLSKSFSFSSGIGASLPGLTSSSQPKSLALSFSIPKENFVLPVVAEGFLTEELNSALSFSTEYSFNKFLSIQSAFTAARFLVENNSSVLKKAHADFEPDFLFAGLFESSLKAPFLKANLSLGLHQNPYDSCDFWLRLDGRTSFRSILLDFTYFCIPTISNSPDVLPLIGIGSSIQKTISFAGVNPQFVLFLPTEKFSSLRFGLYGSDSVKICSTAKAEKLNLAKLRFGAEFEMSSVDLKLDFAAANILLFGTPPNKSNTPEKYYSAGLSGNFSVRKFYFAFSSSCKYYPPYDSSSSDKKNIAFSLTAVPEGNRNFTFQGGFDVGFKDSERNSGNINGGVTVKNKTKFVNSSVKCLLAVPF